jgi:DNA-binding SARP family transcriptional activator
MWLGVLGPLSVRGERAEIAVPASKQRIVLAALARRANQAVSFAELAEAVWDSHPPGDERAALRNYVKRPTARCRAWRWPGTRATGRVRPRR